MWINLPSISLLGSNFTAISMTGASAWLCLPLTITLEINQSAKYITSVTFPINTSCNKKFQGEKDHKAVYVGAWSMA